MATVTTSILTLGGERHINIANVPVLNRAHFRPEPTLAKDIFPITRWIDTSDSIDPNRALKAEVKVINDPTKLKGDGQLSITARLSAPVIKTTTTETTVVEDWCHSMSAVVALNIPGSAIPTDSDGISREDIITFLYLALSILVPVNAGVPSASTLTDLAYGITQTAMVPVDSAA